MTLDYTSPDELDTSAPHFFRCRENLRNSLKSDMHTITLELSPPKGVDPSLMLNRARPLKGLVDAINIPDCQRAILKMSAMVSSVLIQQHLQLDTVWQLTGRDRNLIALQADLLGGWSLGLANVLALTGDPVQIGDHADVAKGVNHLDSLRMLELIQTLNDGNDATGKALPRKGTQFCAGAALNPHRMSREAQINRLVYKLRSGVDFFQTQPVYDLATLKEARWRINDLCQTHQLPVPKLLLGIIPPKSAEFARFMNQHIIGVDIPSSFIDLLERAENPVQESIAYCSDLVASFAPWVDGFHFMPVGAERYSADMVNACLPHLKRPVTSSV